MLRILLRVFITAIILDNTTALNIRKLATCACLTVGFCGLSPINMQPAQAIDKEAVERFEKATELLTNLDANWDSIVKGEGDNIRRQLGTVYAPPSCSSPLCNFPQFISKFVKANGDEIDLEAFEEPSSKALEYLNQADFLAYSSVFSEYGNGGGGKDYMAESHNQVKMALKQLKLLVRVIESPQ